MNWRPPACARCGYVDDDLEVLARYERDGLPAAPDEGYPNVSWRCLGCEWSGRTLATAHKR